jgi:hypothetical protein
VTSVPSPPNLRHHDPDVASVVERLRAAGAEVLALDEARGAARAARRAVAASAFEAGISWRAIAELSGYGSAQAAQQDVTNVATPHRRSGD